MVASKPTTAERIYEALRIARNYHGGTLDKEQWMQAVEEVLEEIGREKVKVNSARTRPARSASAADPADDAAWLASLAEDPTYEGIDVRREFGLLRNWCQVNRKEPTRRRFVQWLAKAERPLNGRIGYGGRGVAATMLPEPAGWLAFLNDEFPESVWSAGGEREAKRWADFDDATRKFLTEAMARR